MHCWGTKNYNCKGNGYTLIELIVSLALLGILAAVLGMGVVGALNIYTVSEENVQIAQQSQLALARIDRELRELTEVIGYSDNSYIIYRNLRLSITGSRDIHAIQFDSTNNRLLLYSGLSSSETNLDNPTVDPDTLLEGVSAFSLAYYMGGQQWDGVNDRFLSHIRTNLTMSRSGSIAATSESFTSLIYLRNTNNYGGATPVVEPPQPPSITSGTYSCFITACLDGHSLTTYVGGTSAAWILAAAVLGGLFFLFALRAPAGRHQRQCPPDRRTTTGSALIAVIVAIVLFSIVAAALLPLVASSGHQTVARDLADKAYLMAESGFRYAAGQYVHAGSSSDAKIAVLNGLHKSLYTTSPGSFDLRVQSYFYRISTPISAGDRDLPTTAPGSLPSPIALMAPGAFNGLKLRVDENHTVYIIDSAAITAENAITFTMTSSMPALSSGGLLYPVVYPDSTQNITNHANLVYQQGTGELFPATNGYLTVTIGNTPYYLNYRMNDNVNHRFVDIVNLDDPHMNLTVTSTDEIVLNRHIRLVSTGSYGSGGFEVSRTVTYDTPLYFGATSEQRRTFEDSFDNSANWTTVEDHGAHAIQVVNNNSRLQVTSTQNAPSSPLASLIALSASDAKETLRKSYQNSGNFLSYDAQAKVGFLVDPTTLGSSNNAYYFAGGISFRLDENNNSYGISIMRANRNTAPPYDYIENNLVPPAAVNKVALVLWRQVNSATNSNWLAYKDIEGWPVQATTLVVRIKEAVVLSFENGAAIPIEKGNVILGQNTGARGRVIQGPILDSDTTWAAGASGYLLLNSVSGDFQSNEDLLVVGRGVLATVRSYSSQRTNIIRVYYGTPDTSVCGAGDTSPFDNQLNCYPLDTSPLLWPPDLKNDGELSWPADDDYFRLIQWDSVNTAGEANLSLVDSDVEPNAIILHHNDALQTPESSYPSTRPELGLHAYGLGATNIYFDDFGLQLTIRVSAVIPTPVQQ